MDIKNKAKHLIREELEKLSKLTWKQRIEHVWEYYKPLMVMILVVISLISLGVTIYRNKQLNRLLTVYMVNCNSIVLNSDEISDEFVSFIGGIGEKDVLRVDTTVYLSEDGSQYSMANRIKITAMVSSGNVDLMLMDPEQFALYEAEDYFYDLREVLSEEQLEKWSDLLIVSEKTGKIIGVDLTDSPVIQSKEAYFGDEVYGGVVQNSQRLEFCDDFFEYLMAEPAAADEELAEEQSENTDSAAE